VVYFADIRAMVVSVLSSMAKMAKRQPVSVKSDDHLKLALFILAGSVPTALIGLALKNFEEVMFTSGLLVGVMMIVTGTILWVSRKFYRTEKTARS
jgi:undecaprenyl-diphosphatase